MLNIRVLRRTHIHHHGSLFTNRRSAQQDSQGILAKTR